MPSVEHNIRQNKVNDGSQSDSGGRRLGVHGAPPADEDEKVTTDSRRGLCLLQQ